MCANMWRWTWNILRALCLGLCVASAWMGVRGLFVGDRYYRSQWTFAPASNHGPLIEARERAIFLISGRGGFAVEIRLQHAQWTGDIKRYRAQYGQVEKSWR